MVAKVNNIVKAIYSVIVFYRSQLVFPGFRG